MTRPQLPVSLMIAASMASACSKPAGDQAQQTRSEIQTAPAPVVAEAPPPPAPAAAPAPAPAPAPAAAPQPAPAPRTPVVWQDELRAFGEEDTDHEWEREREMPLFRIALEHILEQKVKLAWVECRSERCLIRVIVPKGLSYQALDNPWFGTSMATEKRELYDGRARYSYLLQRHAEDYPKFADARVDPLNSSDARSTRVAAQQPESGSVVTRVQALKPAESSTATATQPQSAATQPAPAPAEQQPAPPSAKPKPSP